MINVAVAVLAVNFALMPWSGIKFTGAAVALTVWSVCSWSFAVSQQHRLVGIAPEFASILLGLKASVMYLAISASGAVGALAIQWLAPYDLPLLAAALAVCGMLGAEIAYQLINTARPQTAAPQLAASRTRP